MKEKSKKNGFYTFLRGLVYYPIKFIFPTTTIGKHNIIKGKVITVSNHLQWSDIFLVAIHVPGFRHMMGKKELSQNSFVRFICKKLEVILVNRGAVDLSTVRNTVNYLKSGTGLSIFPEGTRNKTDDEIQDVKAGAFMFSVKGDAPILPVIIHSRSKAFKRNYLIIGKPVYFSQYAGARLTPEILAEGSEIIGKIMRENKKILDDAINAGEIKKLIKIDKSFIKTEKLSKKTLNKFGYKK